MNTEFEYQATRAFTRPLPSELISMGENAHHADEVPVNDEAHRNMALADELDDRARKNVHRGCFKAARVLVEQAMELRRAHFGEADPRLVRSFSWLGELSLHEGKIEEARWLLEQAYQVAYKRFEPKSLYLAATLHNLAVVTRRSGDLARASELAEEALGIKVDQLGWEHSSVAVTLCTLANLARTMGQLRVAIAYYEKARGILERTQGGFGAGLASALIGMARVHLEYGSKVSARFLLERAVQICEAVDVFPAQIAQARLLLSQTIKDEDEEAAKGLLRSACREYAQYECARPELLDRMQRVLLRYDARLRPQDRN